MEKDDVKKKLAECDPEVERVRRFGLLHVPKLILFSHSPVYLTCDEALIRRCMMQCRDVHLPSLPPF